MVFSLTYPHYPQAFPPFRLLFTLILVMEQRSSPVDFECLPDT